MEEKHRQLVQSNTEVEEGHLQLVQSNAGVEEEHRSNTDCGTSLRCYNIVNPDRNGYYEGQLQSKSHCDIQF